VGYYRVVQKKPLATVGYKGARYFKRSKMWRDLQRWYYYRFNEYSS